MDEIKILESVLAVFNKCNINCSVADAVLISNDIKKFADLIKLKRESLNKPIIEEVKSPIKKK